MDLNPYGKRIQKKFGCPVVIHCSGIINILQNRFLFLEGVQKIQIAFGKNRNLRYWVDFKPYNRGYHNSMLSGFDLLANGIWTHIFQLVSILQ